jgi:redox-sensitive bicupin YhaK (pirin superfamily)
MINIRKSDQRGKTKIDWLDSWHSFSFGNYYDPSNMGFGTLRVINEDIVNPGTGFGTHPHRDMEIITYILEGALQHKDSLGTGSVIVPGDVQRMSAGTGITHSEFNPQPDKPVHLLQIWIFPEKDGLPPSYEQKNFTQKREPGKLTLLASKNGEDGSVTIHQDASLYVLDLEKSVGYRYVIQRRRMVWLQVARGEAKVNGQTLKQGDGVAITGEEVLDFSGGNAEILIFDLPEE